MVIRYRVMIRYRMVIRYRTGVMIVLKMSGSNSDNRRKKRTIEAPQGVDSGRDVVAKGWKVHE